MDENTLRAALASMYEELPDAVVLWDVKGRLISANAATEALSGYAPQELVGTRLTDHVLQSDVERIRQAMRAIASGGTDVFPAHMRRVDGETVPLECNAFPARDANGTIVGAFARLRDVAELRSAQERARLHERAVEEQSERIRRLFLTAAARGESDDQQIENTLRLGLELFGFDCAYVAQFDGPHVIVRNVAGDGGNVVPGAAFRADTALSRHLRDERTQLSIPDFDAPEWASDVSHSTSPWRAYFAVQLIVGQAPFGALVFAGRWPRDADLDKRDSDLIGLMALFVASVLERIASSQRIAELAFVDALTGLPNRVLWGDRAARAIASARRYGQGFAVMYVDIDLFKRVNDAFGHRAGDEFLRAAADRLRSSLRESDTLARFDGDEFVILQTMVGRRSDAGDLARKVTLAMQEPIFAADREFSIRTSIGIALYPSDAEDLDALMQLADEALYRAKQKGRNRWCFAADAAEEPAETVAGRPD